MQTIEAFNDKYTLVPYENGIAVVNNETSKRVFFFSDDFDFSVFLVGNVYIIGCETFPKTFFEQDMTTDVIEAFKESEEYTSFKSGRETHWSNVSQAYQNLLDTAVES